MPEITMLFPCLCNFKPRFYFVQLMKFIKDFNIVIVQFDRLCGLVVKVLGYRSGGLGSIPGTTRKKSSGSGTEST
jgi:hypothetical protein